MLPLKYLRDPHILSFIPTLSVTHSSLPTHTPFATHMSFLTHTNTPFPTHIAPIMDLYITFLTHNPQILSILPPPSSCLLLAYQSWPSVSYQLLYRLSPFLFPTSKLNRKPGGNWRAGGRNIERGWEKMEGGWKEGKEGKCSKFSIKENQNFINASNVHNRICNEKRYVYVKY